MLIERDHLLPLAEEDFDLVEMAFPTVNSFGCVKVRTNAYSVPVDAGRTVQAKITPSAVELWHEGRCVASHERCYGRQQEILDLEHYLDVLEHKPGALAGSKPLAQWRQLGRWPASYDRFWAGLIERHGRQKGTKEMIELLAAGAHLRPGEAAGGGGGGAGPGLWRQRGGALSARRPKVDASARPSRWRSATLAAFERPLPDVGDYDQLLAADG